jgi:hypothetical protein
MMERARVASDRTPCTNAARHRSNAWRISLPDPQFGPEPSITI